MPSTWIFICVLVHVTLTWSQRTKGEFPYAIPKKFQVHFQTSNIIYNTTSHSLEYYDGDQKSATLIVWDGELKTQETIRPLNNSNLEQFIILNEGKCTVSDERPESAFLKNGKLLVSTAYLFDMLPKMKSAYDGEYLGIPYETYRIEQVELQKDIKADIEIMWSKQGDWVFPNCPEEAFPGCKGWTVPLLSTLTYKQNGIDVIFQNVYYDYKTTIDDPEAFQVPRGVSCVASNSRKKFVELSPNFVASEEVYDPYSESGFSTKRQIYYNMPEQLIRVELHFPPEDLSDNMAPTQIIDFKSGVSYVSSKKGICTMGNLTSEESVLKDGGKKTEDILAFLLGIASPLDTNGFYYVGKRTVRNILCDVWVTPVTQDNTFYEIYTTNRTIVYEDGTKKEWAVPVFVNKTVETGENNKNLKMESRSYFSFNINPHPVDVYNIAPCYDDNHKKRIQIEFKEGPYSEFVDMFMDSFIRQMLSAFGDKTNSRPWRFQEVLVDHFEHKTNTTILLTTTLVEDSYNAKKVGKNLAQPTNDEIYKKLNDLMYDGNFRITFQTAIGNPSYLVTGIRDDVVPTGGFGSAGAIELLFSKLKGYDFEGQRNFLHLTRVECFERCVLNDGFNCESFSYCETSGTCTLDGNHYDASSDKKLNSSTACTVYSRNYLNDYILNENLKTIGIAGIDKTVTSLVDDKEQCAHQCSKTKMNFYCEGFDVCEKDNKFTCSFRSRHLNEINSSLTLKDTICNHYTRDYLGDFMMIQLKSAKTDSTMQVITVATTALDCAHICATSADFGECKAFEMCTTRDSPKSRTLCRIIDTDVDPKTISLQSDENCDHYQRQHFLPPMHDVPPDQKKSSILPTGTVPADSTSENKTPGDPEKSSASGSSKFSPGDMWGIGIGLFLAGLIIGGLIVVVIMRLQLMKS